MNCKEALKLMDAYLDAELDPVTSQSIEEHQRDCLRCEQTYAGQRRLVRTIESSAPYYQASAELRRRIQSALRDEAGARAGSKETRESRPLSRGTESAPTSVYSGIAWNWLALAAAILLTAIIVWNVAPRFQQHGGNQFLATQLIASHVRSL